MWMMTWQANRERERERRVSVYEKAPRFRLGPRDVAGIICAALPAAHRRRALPDPLLRHAPVLKPPRRAEWQTLAALLLACSRRHVP